MESWMKLLQKHIDTRIIFLLPPLLELEWGSAIGVGYRHVLDRMEQSTLVHYSEGRWNNEIDEQFKMNNLKHMIWRTIWRTIWMWWNMYDWEWKTRKTEIRKQSKEKREKNYAVC